MLKANVAVLRTKVIKRRKTLPTAFLLSHICFETSERGSRRECGPATANELPPTSISHRACKQTMKDVSVASNLPARVRFCSIVTLIMRLYTDKINDIGE